MMNSCLPFVESVLDFLLAGIVQQAVERIGGRRSVGTIHSRELARTEPRPPVSIVAGTMKRSVSIVLRSAHSPRSPRSSRSTRFLRFGQGMAFAAVLKYAGFFWEDAP